jgi:enoyl-CoA hydratase/carnithine racemase
MPELDEHLVVTELLARPFEVVERVLLVHDIRGQLEENASELAGRPQRFERIEEPPEHLAAQLPRRAVDAAVIVDRHLVSEVLGTEALADRAAALAAELAALPTRAIGMTKRLFDHAWGARLDEQLEREAQLQAAATQTDDFREGVAAFLEKRPPVFRGR